MSDQYIVYLFGAGASARTIPPAQLLIPAYQENGPLLPAGTVGELGDVAKYVKSQSMRIAKEARRYASPDTYAKLLSTRADSHEELTLLRLLTETAIAVFETNPKDSHVRSLSDPVDRQRLIWRQDFARFDARYLNWLLSLVQYDGSRTELPPNVACLTWNYDSGLFAALTELFGGWKSAMAHLHTADSGEETMPVVTLNGTVAEQDTYHSEYGDTADTRYLSYLRNAWENPSKHNSPVRFAWEMELWKRSKAKAIIKNATDIVIVGYSFPNFNAEIDNELFADTGPLERIYMQTHRADVSQQIAAVLQVRLEAMGKKISANKERNKIQMIPIGYGEQYFVPPNLQGVTAGKPVPRLHGIPGV